MVGSVTGRQTKPRVGCEAVSGSAFHCFTASVIQSMESGQSTCYQTGQFYLLPTLSHPFSCRNMCEKVILLVCNHVFSIAPASSPKL